MEKREKSKNPLNESSLSRVYAQTQKHDYGTITAFRYARDCGQGEVYTRAENKKRNKVLLGKLKAQGYSITSIKGSYIENFKTPNAKEVKEDSFLVVDIQDKGTLKKSLLKFGQEFEQDSIIFGQAGQTAYLIGTNKCPDSYPGWHVADKQGGALFGKTGEFLSRVNNRPFVFSEGAEIQKYAVCKYPTELRGAVHDSNLEYE